GEFPAASLLRVVERKPVSEIDDRTLILADIGKKAIQQVREAAIELLTDPLPRDQAEVIADKLSTGMWTHDYPLTAEAAKALGLHVSTAMPSEILELLSLYPQPVRSQPSVEYLPVPKGRNVRHGLEP
ncbi:MAG: hypothetical protein D6704_12990, partial [Nitrospirae bacterium]